jgi:effector-binding domain-containing protein
MANEIGKPSIEYRPEKLYMGIRTQTPFQGMFAMVDKLRKELYAWFKAQNIEPKGPGFLRYHVIDMEGDMDITFGIQVAEVLPGDARVTPGVIPAGHYAYLIYSRYALRGNKALLGWGKDNGIRWDVWNDPKGDAFACRCETYLTDPKIEPRKTKWDVDLAIKLADDSPHPLPTP